MSMGDGTEAHSPAGARPPLVERASGVKDREAARVAALERLAILDSEPEEAYDDLVVLASEICGTPIALVSLVGSDRQWFKALVGLEVRQTPRDVAFCAHAIASPDAVFVVPDATVDERFADNPLVTGDPAIRFYAGAPIVTHDGHAVGTVCVIDTEPRTLTASQTRCLSALARQAAMLLDLRQHSQAAARIAIEQAGMAVEARLEHERSAELLDLVLQGRDLGLWDLDVASGRWNASSHELALLGYADPPGALAAVDWRALVHPDDREIAVSSMAAHLRGEQSYYECTIRVRHRDGRWLWMLSRAVVVERDAEDRPARIVGTHLDVTERLRLETERRQVAERLDIALVGGDIGIWDVDLATERMVYNAHWATMLGYTSDEVDTAPDLWRTTLHPDDHAAFFARLSAHLPGEPPIVEGEGRVRHKDGRWVWVLMRAKVFERDEDGRALRVVGVNVDITARRQSEGALERARLLLEETGRLAQVGGGWEIDVVAGRLTWSREVHRIHEVGPGYEPTLEKAIAFYEPQARQTITAAIEAAIAEGVAWDQELPMITARGRRIWVRAIGRAEHEDGRLVRVIGAAQDITARKAAEEATAASERRLRMITDHMPALIMYVDRTQRLRFVNAYLERKLNIPLDTTIGRTMLDVCGEELYRRLLPRVSLALAGEPVEFEEEGGELMRDRLYHTSYVPDVDANGIVVGFYAMSFDITARKRAELRSKASERRLRGITDNLPACIAEFDREGRFRFANATYLHWFGVEPAATIGRSIEETLGAAYFAERRQHVERALAGENVSFEDAVDSSSGSRKLHSVYRPHFDDQQRVAGIYAMANDITELKETQHKLHLLARADALTGLPNRRHLEECATEVLARARRTSRIGALLYLDVDHFKTINDTLGHACGDDLLREFALRLSTVLRETDFVARYAGDEFVALAEGVDNATNAVMIGVKIATAIRAPFTLPTVSLFVTTSIGIATFEGSESLPGLLARADSALYDAKAAGRDTVSLEP